MEFIIFNIIFLIICTFVLKIFKINLIFRNYLKNLKDIINIFKLKDDDEKINLLISLSIRIFKDIFKIITILILIVFLIFLFSLFISEFYNNLFTINFLILSLIYMLSLYFFRNK